LGKLHYNLCKCKAFANTGENKNMRDYYGKIKAFYLRISAVKKSISEEERLDMLSGANGRKKNRLDAKQLRTSMAVMLMLVMLTMLGACSAGNAKAETGKITVYTSFYTMYDFTVKIGGDKVNVINMVPPGMEPHDWEPSPRDIAGLSKASLFIYSGAGMEGWVEKVLQSISNETLVAVETSKGIPLEKSEHADERGENGDEEEGFHESHDYDPHVWLNPMYAKIQMKAIKDGLVRVDPENSRYYEENYNYYAEKLDELEGKYREAAASFSRKEIVVSHAAYEYLCSTYGLKQIAIEGLASGSEPTASKKAEIIDFIAEHDVKVIFFDGLSSSKVADTVAEETGVRTAILNPLEGLSEEDLKAGRDYFSVMEENLEALSDALR